MGLPDTKVVSCRRSVASLREVDNECRKVRAPIEEIIDADGQGHMATQLSLVAVS
jgi:hypothetical protein